MRTRIFGKMLNSEVQEYLKNNDIIIVPVGTTEMHGGFPLDCETVISEAYALKMAEACDGLVLTGLPYFYAGATASGRGTVQVSIRQGIDYLGALARSLLRLGFKRQVYISFHGPAHMTICPMWWNSCGNWRSTAIRTRQIIPGCLLHGITAETLSLFNMIVGGHFICPRQRNTIIIATGGYGIRPYNWRYYYENDSHDLSRSSRGIFGRLSAGL